METGSSWGTIWPWLRPNCPRSWGWMEPCPLTPWPLRRFGKSSWTWGKRIRLIRRCHCCCVCVNSSTPSCKITQVRKKPDANTILTSGLIYCSYLDSVYSDDLTPVLHLLLPGRMYGADDFLPMLTYVVAQCDMPQLDTEVQYMMELLDPSLLQGEGRPCWSAQFDWPMPCCWLSTC